MKLKATFLTVWLGMTLLATAEVPSAEKLLPDDTLIVLTAPDWDKAKSAYASAPMAQLWQDPAMQAFTDKFINKFRTDVMQPLERELGVKFSDYAEVLHGQVTLALTQNGWQGETNKDPAIVLLIDTRDKSEQSQKMLAELKKKWVDGGKQIKVDKVRDVEVATLVMDNDTLQKALENALPNLKKNRKTGSTDENQPKEANKKTEICVGQAGSLLIVGSDTKVFEPILAHLAGSSTASLGELSGYEANHNALFRDATVYGWVNFNKFAGIFLKSVNAKPEAGEGGPQNPLGVTPDKVMDALGLNGMKTVALAGKNTPEGVYLQALLTVPQDQRKGIFKLIAFDAKDASPPPFVPGDVTKYSRWRLDGQKMWTSLESIINDLSPQMGALLQMSLGAAGKDKDPNFDLRKQVIGNLGDDMVSYNKNPRSTKAQDLSSPPSIFLLGSPNAEQLSSALRTGTGFLAAPGGGAPDPKEREFLGRKLYSLPLPPSYDGSKMVERSLNLSASGGYVALSTDSAMVEEYLRSAENHGRPLRETPGLNEAAEKIGGMSTGLFGYENQTETVKMLFEALKQDPDTFDRLFPANSAGPRPSAESRKNREEWLDFTLLPSFDKVAKYFYYTVYSGAIQQDGYSFKSFSPMPPQAGK